MNKHTQYQIGLKVSKKKLSSQNLLLAQHLLTYFLQEQGFDLSSLVEEESRDFLTMSFYVHSKKESLFLFRQIQTITLKGVRCFYKTHLRKDWESSWKKGWKPFSLTTKIQVIPLWQKQKKHLKNKKPLYLETTNAFGTGLHETTRFTSQMIESLENQFQTFLDVGTGSGILMVVAFLMGAKKCFGFDIDAGAIEVAQNNLKVNGYTGQLKKADIRSFVVKSPFDVVAANLISSDLIAYQDKIISFVKKGGFLIISGISLENLSRVQKAFSVSSLKKLKIMKGKEWSAILFHVI